MADCVNIQWKNGFGNQLFQYSYGRILSEQMGCSLTYSGTVDRWEGTSLVDIGFITEDDIINYTDENIKVNIDYNTEQAVELENPQNYKPYLDEIRSWFPEVEITNTKDLLVHVRVGDNGPNIYTPFEWYKKAIEDNNIEFDKMYIVTDTPNDRSIKEFKLNYNVEFISHETITTLDDRRKYKNKILEDFNFMRKFDKVLFSNSTYPWWSSLLSNPSKVWFNKEWQPNHYNGMIKLGETDYDNWNGINPFSLKEK